MSMFPFLGPKVAKWYDFRLAAGRSVVPCPPREWCRGRRENGGKGGTWGLGSLGAWAMPGGVGHPVIVLLYLLKTSFKFTPQHAKQRWEKEIKETKNPLDVGGRKQSSVFIETARTSFLS